MRYRAVLLDLYGTLVQDDDAVVTQICARVGDPAAVRQDWTARLWAAAEPAHGRNFRTLADLTLTSLAATVAHFGASADVAELCRPQRAFWRRAPLLAETRDLLAAIDVPICLVSDADRHDVDVLLAHHGIRVDAVVTSEDARAYKPRPEPFELALAHLNRRAGEVVHIGDSAAADVAGATALGIPAIHLDPRTPYAAGVLGRLRGGA